MNDALRYLEAVLPEDGYRVIAHRPRGWANGFQHTFVSTNDAVIRAVETLERQGLQSWIALATYVNPEDGRKATNTAALKCLWVDVDYKQYDTPDEAHDAIDKLAEVVGEPSAMVLSGGGVHGYWLLERELPTAEWKPLADAFQATWQRLGLKADPISGDAARVLRMPGTFNRKADYDAPRLVEFFDTTDAVYDPDELGKLLGAAAPKALIPLSIGHLPPAMRHVNDDLSGGLEHRESFIQPIIQKCKQLRENFANRASLQEPLWYATLGLVRHVHDGRKVAHAYSNTHPGYSPDGTDAKLVQLDPIGPTTCSKFKLTNPAGCEGCKYNVTTPLQLGYPDEPEINAQPVIQIERTEVTAEGTVEVVTRMERPDIEMPHGFAYDGDVITRRVKDEETGNFINDVVFQGFICPERIIANHRLNHATEVQLYVHANGQPPKRLTIPGKAISDKKDLGRELSGKGVFSMTKNSNHILDLLQRMVQQVQSTKKDAAIAEQMGWQEGGEMFVVGSTGYQRGMAPQYDLPIPTGSKSTVHQYEPAGTLAEWKKTAAIYSRPGAEAYQFALCYGAAGVFLPMTKLSGVVLSLYSQSAGRGKSTAGYAALSWFGNPNTMKSQSKDTNNALFNKASRHKNLPILMDEITDKPPRELEDLVYFMTQGREKESMTADRVVRAVLPEWALPVISTSNNSIRSKLQSNRGDAQGLFARIIEVPMDLQFAQQMGFNNRMQLRTGFAENYGHAGPILVKFLMENEPMCRAVLDSITAKLDAAVEGDSAYRFWVASAASALTVATAARHLGLIDYDLTALTRWTMELLRTQRVDAVTNLASSEDVLAQFLELNANRVLVAYNRVIGAGATAPAVWPEEGVYGSVLVGRAELPEQSLYISVPAFSRFCHEAGFDMASFIRNASMRADGVSGEPLLKRSGPTYVNLGRGTKTASARTKALEFNLMHHALREFAVGAGSKADAATALRSVK